MGEMGDMSMFDSAVSVLSVVMLTTTEVGWSR
jgi:hypothetical protein